MADEITADALRTLDQRMPTEDGVTISVTVSGQNGVVINEDGATYVAPRVFVSYSHESEDHKAWVLRLADRLIRNGVDVILDQYDLRLGEDLPGFMESGLSGADRVLAISSDGYVLKANSRRGGVGYERRILTADLMDNLDSSRVIPIIRDNSETGMRVLPTFLGSALYIDFRDDDRFERNYVELIHEIFGEQIIARPPLGPNPFSRPTVVPVTTRLSMEPARYVSPALSGHVTFEYSNNNGKFHIGSGDKSFTLMWTEAGYGVIHFYSDPDNIRSVALAPSIKSFAELGDATRFDNSSRSRSARVGDVAIFENTHGYYAAVRILRVLTRGSSDKGEYELQFEYSIQANHTPVFG